MRVLSSQTAAIVLAWGMASAGASAQFHAKTDSGKTAVNQQAVNSATQQAAAAMSNQGSNAQVGAGAFSTLYLSEHQKQQFGARLGEQKTGMIHVWGRAIHHTDGTFTESKQDELTNTLEQITRSKNGVKLQRRMVMLDEYGRPQEVMMYDGRDTFKYRGVLLYDQLGRFQEEQLYDSKGTLIRRKVQEYDPQGKRLPLRSWDYVENVPPELKLVITRESEDATNPANSQGGSNDKPRNWLGGNRNSEGQVKAGQSSEAKSEDPGKKGRGLGRLFGGNR